MVQCGDSALPKLKESEDIRYYGCVDGRWQCLKDACVCERSRVPQGSVCENGKARCGEELLDYKFVSDFVCYEDQWLCKHEDGCACAAENCKGACVKGECVESSANMDLALNIEARDSSYKLDILDEFYCAKGNCPCGDGACAMGATCLGDICVCGSREPGANPYGDSTLYTNDYGEFRCKKAKSTFTCEYSEWYFMCARKDGCHTRDGRHFYTGMTTIKNKNDAHVDSGMVKTRIEHSLKHTMRLANAAGAVIANTAQIIRILLPGQDGICVLNRSDGLPLYTSLKDAKNKDFVCDDRRCQCRNQSCVFAELCVAGKCDKDRSACHAHELGDKAFRKILEFNEKKSINYMDDAIYADNVDDDDDHVPEFGDDDNEDSYDEYIPEGSKSISIYNVMRCIDGKLYCFGVKNKPIPAPTKSAGYECDKTSSLPGYESLPQNNNDWSIDYAYKAWVCKKKNGCSCGKKQCAKGGVCINEECYCGSQKLLNAYSCDDELMYCEKDQCDCGEESCSRGNICKDGKCLCRNEKSPQTDEKGYACQNDVYHPVCTRAEGCECGETKCSINASCVDKQCKCVSTIMLNPGNNYVCNTDLDSAKNKTFAKSKEKPLAWYCINPEGCNCYGKKIDSGATCDHYGCSYGVLREDGCYCGDDLYDKDSSKHKCSEFTMDETPLLLCDNFDGCACAGSTCPRFTHCKDGKCYSPQTMTLYPAQSDGYETQSGVPHCGKEDGCPCENNTCLKQQICYKGECLDDNFIVVIDNKLRRFIWGLDGRNENELIYSNNAFDCNAKKAPKNIKDYACVISSDYERICTFCEKRSQHLIGWQCQNPKGCQCGKTMCKRGAICKDDKSCHFDPFYEEQFCSIEYTLQERCTMKKSPTERAYVDAKGQCICGPHVMPPNFKAKAQYRCTNGGWLCKHKAGCHCGDELCENGAYCIEGRYCTK
ncbi:MAG: hypothetical protein WC966_02780 [Bradymonadales bacterium]